MAKDKIPPAVEDVFTRARILKATVKLEQKSGTSRFYRVTFPDGDSFTVAYDTTRLGSPSGTAALGRELDRRNKS